MYGMKFGVEMEATGRSPGHFIYFLQEQYSVDVGIREQNDSVYSRSVVDFTRARRAFYYRHAPYIEFAVKGDGSVRGPASEVVSSPLVERDLPYVKDVIQKMKAGGLRAHESAGLHIHVSPQEPPLLYARSPAWKRAFFHNWRVLMPKIKKTWAPYSRRKGYCEPEFSFRMLGTMRYLAVNATRDIRGTVEFRLFNSVLDYRWVCRAVRFACGLTRLALEGIWVQTVGHGESINRVMSRLLSERRPA